MNIILQVLIQFGSVYSRVLYSVNIPMYFYSLILFLFFAYFFYVINTRLYDVGDLVDGG